MTVDEAMQLALGHQQARRINEADVLYTEILKVAPDHLPALQQMGCLAFEVGRFDIAARMFARTVALQPGHGPHHSNLGEALRMQGDSEAAARSFAEAMRLDPNDWIPCKNLGLGLVLMGRLREAVEAFGRITAIEPSNAEGWFLQGYAKLEMGLQREAIALLRKAVKLNPNLQEAHSHLLIALNHDDEGDPEAVFAEYLRFGKQFNLPLPPRAGPVPAGRKIRVGFISPDFRQHSVAYFLEPVLRLHDRSRFEFFGYSTSNRRDQVTDIFQGWLAGLRNITPMTDDQAADQIRADGIDILVDLVGHTPGHRLGVIARKPAPVQVSWLGYPNTTGMAAVDCRLTDALADPPGMTEALHTEKLVRLPGSFVCYGKLVPELPPVAPLPALKNGFVTFGSFGRFAKLTPQMVAVWSRILHRVPDSKLFLKSFSFKDEDTRASLLGRFAQHGIGPERLRLEGFRECLHDHLLVYHEIDIALDTFPYHGTTTTCEALQMGVPVVSLIGRTHVARVGASLLAQVGLDEWAAPTEDAYVACAVKWAGQVEALAALRANLRPAFAAAPMADSAGFTRIFENALERMVR